MLTLAPAHPSCHPPTVDGRTAPGRRQPSSRMRGGLGRAPARSFGTALLAALVLATPPARALDTPSSLGAGDIQTSGCGITMSCAPDPAQDESAAPESPGAGQCVANNAGNPCGSASGPASQGSATGQDVGAGNPIDVLSGNKYQQEVDLPALPGVLGLEIVRQYNSRRARLGDVGALGTGWRLSYETRLHIRDDRLEITQADGARVIFPRRAGVPQRCASRDPGRGEILIRPRAGGGDDYLWRWPDGRSLLFDRAGRLVQILVPSGEFVSLRHDSAGRLLQVTDPQGRSLQLHYHPPGSRVDGIAYIDSPLGRFSYRQERTVLPTRTDAGKRPGPSIRAPERRSSSDRFQPPQRGASARKTSSPRTAAARLVRVDYPGPPNSKTGGAAAREYHYEDPRHPIALTGISVLARQPEGPPIPERIASYAYDATGRGIRSVRGALPAAGESGPEDVRLEYPARGRTVLTNSLGQRTTYLGAVIAGERRVLEARGPGCARCGWTDVRYGYAPDGRLSAITTLDTEGRPRISTQHRFDALGRIAETLTADLADGRARLLDRVRYEYPEAPATALAHMHLAAQAAEPAAMTPPSAVIRPSVVPGREHRIELRYNTAGQPIELRESGFSPVDAEGRTNPVPIERRITWRYTTINGRSVLAEIDGPLPDGPDASPLDSDLVRLHWDERGSFIRTLEGPGGRRSEIDSDPATGLPLRVRDAEGHETRLRHDSAAQVIGWRSQAPGKAAGSVRAAEYDALGHLVELRAGDDEENLHPRWRRAFDAAGRLQWHADALGILQTWAYDHESRVVETALRSASRLSRRRWRYDEHGRLVGIDGDKGFTRSLRHDAIGRLVGIRDSHGRELLRPVWHEAGRAGTASPPARPRRLHDDFGRAVLERSPDAGERWRSFDAGGRLVAMGDPLGHRARYTWDLRGRILAQEITDGRSGTTETTRWRYDGPRLLEVEHPNGRERHEHDQRGLRSARIVSLKRDDGELVVVTRYEHDAEGRLLATTLPDGSRLRYERNGQGQVVAVKRQPVATPWLRGLAREQTIASAFERDLFGLRGFLAGNGVRALHERTRAGTLIRVAIEGAKRHPREAARSADTPLLDYRYAWDPEGNLLHERRHEPGSELPSTRRSQAYDLRNQLVASVEWRDDGGLLAETGVWRYAYDRHQRRVLAQEGTGSQQDLVSHTRRPLFASGTHRVLSSRPNTPGHPQAAIPPARVGEPGPAGHHDPSGQPGRLGSRSLHWDALGRLIEVREADRDVARYAYDHRGLRIRRTRFDPARAAPAKTHTVHDDARQPLAELDADGRLIRQYVWLADLPLAVLDTAAHPDTGTGSARRILEDLVRIVQSWLAPQAGLAWLHTNHLGAPELATDADGQPIWRARYAPFGAATVTSTPARPDFTLDLRLPGQVFDAETGLHYNRARYYDPAAGQYLTPDPLGTPDGPNPYAYAAFNPLRNVDPDGLVLFAFDGTDNSWDRHELERLGGSETNVARFWRLYDSGNRHYVSGVGTRHYENGRTNYLGEAYEDILPKGFGPVPDRGGNYTGRERIERMWEYLIDEAEALDDKAMMDIDIVGFSRGASQAREFANTLAEALVEQDGRQMIRYPAIDRDTRREVTRCQPAKLRFMGLFDTVLSTDLPFAADYRLAIPDEFSHVAHAVALNEYRSQPIGWDTGGYPFNAAFWNDTRRNLDEDLHQGGFPLESIGASSRTPGQIRIERGFIGAHADIGGGYGDGENELSFIALNWMVKQAELADVTMKPSGLEPLPTFNPIIHDQSNSLRVGHPDNPERHMISKEIRDADTTRTEWELLRAEDREVRGAVSGATQRTMGFTAFGPRDRSMVNADTHNYITYFDRPVGNDPDKTWNALTGNQTGTVNIANYMDWLKRNGYGFPDR